MLINSNILNLSYNRSVMQEYTINMKILIYILFLFSLSINAYAFDEDCINSKQFPFCLYKDSKIDFIILRDEKEVGWHKVAFEKTNDGFKVETTAYIKARYLLFLDYVFEYSSISNWVNNQLINQEVLIDDDGTLSVEFGAYGVPETFLINKNKKIISKFLGPLNQETFEEIQSIIK